ncbi:MAG: DUF262 domain-containing protein [bacterium]|nr:DUF262 domain-containing protein [bacterium]
MEKKFTSDEVPLAQMLEEARVGKLQLPDFQRGWVWDDNHIASLLASISVSYPIGAVMTLQTGNPDVKFRPRPLEGAEVDGDPDPEVLLLDGQQRATSLYLALKSEKPVPTRDSKGKDMERIYVADINACLDPFVDREDAIFGMPADGITKTFRGEVILDASTREAQIENEVFPLGIVLDMPTTMAWQLAYLAEGPGEAEERLDKWTRFTETLVNSFVQYQVPTIQLVRSTPKEAVCQVFEKVNTGGVSLTVFELLTATYAADDFNLRDHWTGIQDKLKEQPLLDRFEATDFLQVVTLLATRKRRLDHLDAHPQDERAPAVTCKRKDILRLDLADYQKWAADAVAAIERVVPFLHGEHIFNARDLPYASQLVPLAAIFAVLGDKAEEHAARQALRRWYWCGVFGEMYGGSTETRFALDLQDVVPWIESGADEPRTVKDAQFQAERLLTLRSRLSAAYKGLLAIQMKRGGRDFRTGNTIDIHAYVDDAIDIHHIFPRKWCTENGYERGVVDCVVNKTAIDAKTNKQIGGAAPSKYLERIQTKTDIAAAELDGILSSHDIDPVALRQDDFAGFFNRRFERLLKQISEAMGKSVNRSADRAESPFVDPGVDKEATEANLRALLASGESKVVEFKSTGRKNLHTGDKDPKVEWSIVKTVAGFMNAYGGTLLVGVNDEGEVVGIEQDYPLLSKADRDGWELWLTGLISSTLGMVAASETTVTIVELDGHELARIEAGPAASAVFAVPTKGEKTEKFMARVNNSTQEISGQDLLDYQKKRWPS